MAKRNSIILALLLGVYSVFAQHPASGIFPLKDSIIYYDALIKYDSTSINEKYLQAKMWGATAFENHNEAKLVDEKEDGLIVWKGNIAFPIAVPGTKTHVVYQYSYLITVNIDPSQTLITATKIRLNELDDGILNFGNPPVSSNKKFTTALNASVRQSFIQLDQHIKKQIMSLKQSIR